MRILNLSKPESLHKTDILIAEALEDMELEMLIQDTRLSGPPFLKVRKTNRV
jgi:hypothetical protein